MQGRINELKLSNPPDEFFFGKHYERRVKNFIQFLICCRDDLREVFKDPLVQMIEQIKYVVGVLDLHEYSFNETANSTIMTIF